MFLVCGEALYDVFLPSGDPAVLHLEAVPGGSPFNVAIGLARLGQPVAFFGGVASDFLGDRLLRCLEKEGVSTRWVPRLPAPATLGFVSLGEDGSPSYAFYGEQAADRQLDASRLPQLGDEVRAIHLGSYSSVVRPVADALEALVRRECATRLITYDPNVRLNVVPDPARWQQRIETLAALVHVLKISSEDVSLLYGKVELEALAARWLQRGVELVVVTLGALGARAWTRHGHAFVPGLPLQPVDTVGAGDTVQAAMLAYLAEAGALDRRFARWQGAQLESLLAFAMRAAAVTCSRRGADLPRRAEIGGV